MYTLNFFIRKAESINPALWITGSYGTNKDSHCFLGHCGARAYHTDDDLPEEAKYIEDLFGKYGLCLVDINDAPSKQFPQKTPDQRIIAALYWIRGEMAIEQAQEIVNEVGEVV